MSELNSPSFGDWLKSRRRALDVTQKQLAERVECAEITIRKIEANQLRPSKHLARALLKKLNVPRGEHDGLVQLARQRPGTTQYITGLDAEERGFTRKKQN